MLWYWFVVEFVKNIKLKFNDFDWNLDVLFDLKFEIREIEQCKLTIKSQIWFFIND